MHTWTASRASVGREGPATHDRDVQRLEVRRTDHVVGSEVPTWSLPRRIALDVDALPHPHAVQRKRASDRDAAHARNLRHFPLDRVVEPVHCLLDVDIALASSHLGTGRFSVIVSASCARLPGSTLCNEINVRSRRPAPQRTSTAAATSTTTRTLRNLPPRVVVRLSVPMACTTDSPVDLPRRRQAEHQADGQRRHRGERHDASRRT